MTQAAAISSKESFENILHKMVYDSTYDEISPPEMSGYINSLSVFNAEYRIIRAKERMDAGLTGRRERDYNSMIKRLLAAANGKAAYNVELEKILGRLKEYKHMEKSPENTGPVHPVPMTLIAYKTVSGHIICSVERMFCKWDEYGLFMGNLNSGIYMENAAETILKFEKEKYNSVGVIGKGDFAKPVKKVFGEQFGYTVR